GRGRRHRALEEIGEALKPFSDQAKLVFRQNRVPARDFRGETVSTLRLGAPSRRTMPISFAKGCGPVIVRAVFARPRPPSEEHSMSVTPAFAQTGGAAPGGADMLIQFLPFVLIFVIVYFLIIRPQREKAKQHQA